MGKSILQLVAAYDLKRGLEHHDRIALRLTEVETLRDSLHRSYSDSVELMRKLAVAAGVQSAPATNVHFEWIRPFVEKLDKEELRLAETFSSVVGEMLAEAERRRIERQCVERAEQELQGAIPNGQAPLDQDDPHIVDENDLIDPAERFGYSPSTNGKEGNDTP